jgi:hypothetical protein
MMEECSACNGERVCARVYAGLGAMVCMRLCGYAACTRGDDADMKPKNWAERFMEKVGYRT